VHKMRRDRIPNATGTCECDDCVAPVGFVLPESARELQTADTRLEVGLGPANEDEDEDNEEDEDEDEEDDAFSNL
jgi:hypothetical protein